MAEKLSIQLVVALPGWAVVDLPAFSSNFVKEEARPKVGPKHSEWAQRPMLTTGGGGAGLGGGGLACKTQYHCQGAQNTHVHSSIHNHVGYYIHFYYFY